jgi:hypothetical protein
VLMGVSLQSPDLSKSQVCGHACILFNIMLLVVVPFSALISNVYSPLPSSVLEELCVIRIRSQLL